MDAEKKYPLLFWLHGAGNPIESEETMTGFAQIAAREGFMIAMPQDTTPKKIEAILELVAERCRDLSASSSSSAEDGKSGSC